jgi:hypothetical protein
MLMSLFPACLAQVDVITERQRKVTNRQIQGDYRLTVGHPCSEMTPVEIQNLLHLTHHHTLYTLTADLRPQ